MERNVQKISNKFDTSVKNEIVFDREICEMTNEERGAFSYVYSTGKMAHYSVSDFITAKVGTASLQSYAGQCLVINFKEKRLIEIIGDDSSYLGIAYGFEECRYFYEFGSPKDRYAQIHSVDEANGWLEISTYFPPDRVYSSLGSGPPPIKLPLSCMEPA